eukprot:jgi/Hompol1/1275/HPOL_001152-RA
MLYQTQALSEKESASYAALKSSALFRRYQLLIDKNLRSSKNCPPGIYLLPDPDNLYYWHGVIFIHRGYYREGVFKFHIEIPANYPESIPTVRFLTDMFHPLIDRDGFFNLAQQFPTWRPNHDCISHILHYVKNAFRESTIAGLDDAACLNAEAARMFATERSYFAKLASQCAQLSSSEPILFDSDVSHLITFSPIDESKFSKIQNLLL